MTVIENNILAAQTKPLLQNWRTITDETHFSWHMLADQFAPISLAEMDGVSLLDRLDTKFLMTTGQLRDVLAELRQDYWMLDVEGIRLNHYRTLYFDTPSFGLYHAHVNRRPERYKVRSREYIDSELAFFEVKHRTRKDRTIKDRIRTSEQVITLTHEIDGWLEEVSPIDGTTLEPKLWNAFLRMTLVNKQCCERVTLDLGLEFSACGRRVALDGVAITEVKRDHASGSSAILAQMRARHIHPRGFSKYAMGVAMLYEGVKKNTLKPRLLLVEKLMEGSKNG